MVNQDVVEDTCSKRGPDDLDLRLLQEVKTKSRKPQNDVGNFDDISLLST